MPAPPESVARLAAMTAAETDPELTPDDLELLLGMNAILDGERRAPGDEDWTPTYHYGKAAAEGWRWKAGRVSARVDAQADDGSLKRSQLHAACMAMARAYAAQGLEAVALRGITAPLPADLVGIVNLPEPDYPDRPRGWPGGARR